MNKTYSLEEFLKWMMKQPNNRAVDMCSGDVEHTCQCVLSQFLRGKGFRKGNVYVCGNLMRGSKKSGIRVKLDTSSIFNLFVNLNGMKTFGELKKNLHPKYKKLLDS